MPGEMKKVLYLIVFGVPVAVCGLWLLSARHLNLVGGIACFIVFVLLGWVGRKA